MSSFERTVLGLTGTCPACSRSSFTNERLVFSRRSQELLDELIVKCLQRSGGSRSRRGDSPPCRPPDGECRRSRYRRRRTQRFVISTGARLLMRKGFLAERTARQPDFLALASSVLGGRRRRLVRSDQTRAGCSNAGSMLAASGWVMLLNSEASSARDR